MAHINLEAQAWGETPVSLDVKLKVHDPSGAAGVNVDLIRMAASALRTDVVVTCADATVVARNLRLERRSEQYQRPT